MGFKVLLPPLERGIEGDFPFVNPTLSRSGAARKVCFFFGGFAPGPLSGNSAERKIRRLRPQIFRYSNPVTSVSAPITRRISFSQRIVCPFGITVSDPRLIDTISVSGERPNDKMGLPTTEDSFLI
jgi:hypothetical protein